jgi:1,2-phenylacetyl-CoA epoxidase PaaB subunit
MIVWDVLGKRTDDDEFAVVGGVKAPDAEMALVLARETHFRHKEGVQYAVRRRGDDEIRVGPWDHDQLGGITDRSYRRQEAYAGVGAKLKRVAGALADRGRVDEALALLGRRERPVSKPRDHHLRLWYALADLEERAGNLPRARALFDRIRRHDAGFADVAERLAALG